MGRLIYAGRVGSGMRTDQLADLLTRLRPLQTDRMPLDVAPPRSTRFGSPLVLSRVHWVQPKLVVEVKYLTWTEDRLLRQVVYEEVREDKPPREVVRETPSARQCEGLKSDARAAGGWKAAPFNDNPTIAAACS
jgi:ATP-dependent DNA ligase